MELRELRSLASLAETGSLALTASRLNLSPAAIHRQLKILSEELGVILYERSGRELRLTQTAESLLPLVHELLGQYEALRTAAGELRGVERGTIRIGAGPTFSNYLLPQLLERFRAAHPSIEILVDSGHSGQLTEKLRHGLLDLVFLVSHGASDFVVERQWAFDIVLVASPSLKLGRIRKVRDLRDQPFLLYKQGTVFEEIIESYLDSHGFQPRVTMRLDNAEPIKAMLLAGFGVSMLPLWSVQDELRSGQLIRIRSKEASLSANVGMMRRRSNYLPPAVRAFSTIAARWRPVAKL